MEFEWDAAKGAKVQSDRGLSFEEIAALLDEQGALDVLAHPNRSDQKFFIVRIKREVWVVVIEVRAAKLRIVTAYPNRKLRKKYGL